MTKQTEKYLHILNLQLETDFKSNLEKIKAYTKLT